MVVRQDNDFQEEKTLSGTLTSVLMKKRNNRSKIHFRAADRTSQFFSNPFCVHSSIHSPLVDYVEKALAFNQWVLLFYSLAISLRYYARFDWPI